MAKQTEINDALLPIFSIQDGKIVGDQEAINAHVEQTSGMSMKDIRKLQKTIADVTVDLAGAAGKVAIDHFADNKDVVAVEGKFTIGRQTTTLTSKEQHVQRPMGTDPNGVSKTVYGHLTARTTSGISKDAVRDVRKVLCEYGETRIKPTR